MRLAWKPPAAISRPSFTVIPIHAQWEWHTSIVKDGAKRVRLDGQFSLPLNGAGGLGSDVVNDAVDADDFVHDAAGDGF